MQTLRIEIQDAIWPQVALALAQAYELPVDGKPSREWAEHIAAGLFADRVAELMQPPEPKPPRRRIRPSRVTSS